MNCGICMTALSEEAETRCPACNSRYHAECWQENAGCAVYGCSEVPQTDRLKPIEIPPSYWGREEKECPRCGTLIKAMATRCRHCGAQVQAKVEEKTAYDRRERQKARAPRLRRASILFLTLSLIPALCVIPALFGTVFYRKNREEIRRLAGSYDGYYRISIAVGTTQVTVFVVALLAWWIRFEILER